MQNKTDPPFYLLGLGTPVMDFVADSGSATDGLVRSLVADGVGVLDQKNYPDDATFELILKRSQAMGVSLQAYGGGTTANKLVAAVSLMRFRKIAAHVGLVCAMGEDDDAVRVREELSSFNIACVPRFDDGRIHHLARSLIFQTSYGSSHSAKLTFTSYGDARDMLSADCVRRGFLALGLLSSQDLALRNGAAFFEASVFRKFDEDAVMAYVDGLQALKSRVAFGLETKLSAVADSRGALWLIMARLRPFIVTGNAEEWGAFLETDGDARALFGAFAQMCSARGMDVPLCLFTDGHKGVYARTPDGVMVHQAACHVSSDRVISTTGAGDGATGVYVASLLLGFSVEQALEAAVHVGAKIVQSPQTRLDLAGYGDVFEQLSL